MRLPAIVAVALLAVSSPARAKDLGKLSDVLALAYLGQDVVQLCGFAKDGRGNLLRSAATSYEALIEDSILSGLTDEDADAVVQASERKSQTHLRRLAPQAEAAQTDTAADAGSGALGSWCAAEGEAVVERVVSFYHLRRGELQKEIEAAKR